MIQPNRDTVSVVVQFLQLATLVIGVAGIFLTVGRKDARLETNTKEISDLRSIASDLVRASVESTGTNRDQDRQLDDLRARIARLEPTR
jgi:hypothetical protein